MTIYIFFKVYPLTLPIISYNGIVSTTRKENMKKPRCNTNGDVIEHIDPTKKVRVYRNLHRKCISVKQDGIVKCWTTNIVLKDCKFIISKAGQKRVRNEKRKNVHAFVEGYLVNVRETDKLKSSTWTESYYNPYHTDTFQERKTGQPITSAKFVDVWVDEKNSHILSHKSK